MEKIKKNTLVAISLKTEDEEGNLLEENEEFMYLHGSYGQVFQKLEEELEGKEVAEKFNLLLTPLEAFGEYKESLVMKEALVNLPDDLALGMEFEDDEEKGVWVVKSMTDGYATLNANHELAGLPVRVSGKILEIEHLSEDGVKKILNMEHTH